MDNSLRWSKRFLLGQFSRKQYPFTRLVCRCIHNVLAPFDKLYQAGDFHRRTLITAPHGAIPNSRICSASTCQYTENTHVHLKKMTSHSPSDVPFDPACAKRHCRESCYQTKFVAGVPYFCCREFLLQMTYILQI